TRMEVNRKPLGAVEELDQEAGGGAEPLDVRLPEPALRIVVDRIAEEASVREAREALLRIVPPGVPRRGHGADPVLGMVAVALRLAAQAVDQRASAVEAVDAIHLQKCTTHARSLAEFLSTMSTS